MKKVRAIVSIASTAALAAGMSAHADVTVTNLVVSGPGAASRTVTCWAPDGLRDGEAAVYVFLEQSVDFASSLLKPLMASGTVPPGVAVCFAASWYFKPGDPGNRFLRAEEFDQIGPDYPTFIIETIIPAVEKSIGLRTSADPNLHFITGASSGGIAAFNACWYRNDYFRRAYCNSPTFSAIRGGNTLMPLVRKCEARPIRTWISVGTDEPDYYFGDSYLVAEDAVSALRFAGYEVRYDRLPHEDHGTQYWNRAYQEKVLAWLFEDWRTKPVSVATDPIRVRETSSCAGRNGPLVTLKCPLPSARSSRGTASGAIPSIRRSAS